MAKTQAQLAEEARKDIATAMSKVGRMANVALDSVTDDEIRAGFRETQKEAPFFVHFMKAAYVAQVRIDATQAPAVQQSLNVTIVQRAGSNEEWLKMAEPHKRQAIGAAPDKLPAVVDVEPVAVKK